MAGARHLSQGFLLVRRLTPSKPSPQLIGERIGPIEAEVGTRRAKGIGVGQSPCGVNLVDGRGQSMKKFSTVVLSLMFGLGLTVATATAQQAPVNLGSNSTFAVLAGTAVTVTGGGTITGNVGIYPGDRKR